jgi:hypothetical protein
MSLIGGMLGCHRRHPELECSLCHVRYTPSYTDINRRARVLFLTIVELISIELASELPRSESKCVLALGSRFEVSL